MLGLPDETFATNCPYRIKVRRKSYYLGPHITFVFDGPRYLYRVPPDILTHSAIYNFIENIHQYGQGTLAISEEWNIQYNADRPTLITMHFSYLRRSVEIPFCRELFDALLYLAT